MSSTQDTMQCLSAFPNTSKLAKNTSLCVAFILDSLFQSVVQDLLHERSTGFNKVVPLMTF